MTLKTPFPGTLCLIAENAMRFIVIVINELPELRETVGRWICIRVLRRCWHCWHSRGVDFWTLEQRDRPCKVLSDCSKAWRRTRNRLSGSGRLSIQSSPSGLLTSPDQVVKTLLNPLAGKDRPHMIFARSENFKVLACSVWGRWR